MLCAVLSTLTGCTGSGETVRALTPVEDRAVAATPLPQVPQPTPTPAPTPDPVKIGANEAGRIPILMYHSVGENSKYDKHGLNIRPETFRKHMQMLYDNGFYPMNMRDILSPKMNVPAGKTPVVITFDDGRGSQFRYRKNGQIDPNSAVGILDSFHKKYGNNWPQRAVFYIMPRSQYNPTPFWTAGEEKKKLNYLVSAGYEVANHSTSHRAMSKLNADQVEWEMKTCIAGIKKLAPGATMDTVALPYGIYPKKPYENILLKYNKCILMAWGDANYAPIDKRYDIKAIQRIGSEPGHIERWISVLAKAKKTRTGLRPYVSDGNPNTITVPQSAMATVQKARLGGAELVVYTAPTTPATPAKKVAQKPIQSTDRK
ncbi:MAG: polysaccharide deacetylase family protein [Armatimonadaceae bacterium]